MSSPYTVTATIFDPSATGVVGNAFVRFRLRNFDGYVPIVSSTGVFIETQLDAFPGAGGAVSQSIVGNNNITPANTYYTVEFWNNGRLTSSGNYQISGNTNLNTASTINPSPTPAPPNTIVFQNNGAMNSSQTTLNLESSDGSVVITDEGLGTLDLTVTGSSLSGNGAYFFGPGITDLGTIYGASLLGSATMNGTAGVVQVYLFELTASYTISKASVLAIGSQFGVHGYFGIYSYAGVKLVDGGSFLDEASSNVQTNSFTPVTLPPGTYWFAQATSSTGVGQYVGITVSGSGANAGKVWTQNTTRAATAANAISGGALPATLGTLTPFIPSNSNSDSIICPLFE